MHRRPAPRAVFADSRTRGRPTRAHGAAVVILVAALLAACGQKGPLFLPSSQGSAARPAAHVPSAPEDRMPPGPAVPPMPSDEPLAAPTGVVPSK